MKKKITYIRNDIRIYYTTTTTYYYYSLCVLVKARRKGEKEGRGAPHFLLYYYVLTHKQTSLAGCSTAEKLEKQARTKKKKQV